MVRSGTRKAERGQPYRGGVQRREQAVGPGGTETEEKSEEISRKN